MEDMLTNLETYGYVVLFLYSFGGGFLALMGAGVLSYTGHMDLTTSILVAFIANFIGDMVLFYMGRYNKKEVMVYMHKHKRKLALAHILMKKHGSWVVFLQKYVYGIKTLIPLAIGITKYNLKKFAILNLIAAALWALVIGIGSYMAGEAIRSAYEVIAQRPWIAPIALISIIALTWWYLNANTSKRSR
ncbi:DedA family protein [Sulfurimonas sp. MAG313]|nr:DedA family protein [Sulfurimonas sp. MAG313]MDF1880816.1 DedA family protein [Sulfurimonas sp. MAG313]